MAEEIARAESVIFVDCAVDLAPGKVRVEPVNPASTKAGVATHQTGAPELLALSQELYASLPRNAVLLTIGAGSMEMGETFSDSMKRALPGACSALELEILRALARSSQ